MRLFTGLLLLVSLSLWGQSKKALPVIDMHLHALPANWEGPPPVGMCAPFEHWSVHDPRESGMNYVINTLTKNLYCNGTGFMSPSTDDSVMTETLKVMRQYNVYGVTSGFTYDIVQKWYNYDSTRIIPGMAFATGMKLPVDTLRKWFSSGKIKVFGEISTQYEGITLSDSIMEPYLAMAEELDIPVSVHVGPGPPGIAYANSPGYRARLHSALVIEEALIRHPKLRVIVAHAGWPMIDDMLAVLYTHPQVYVDLGIICYGFPKKEFYGYLQRLVDAGFGKRICFGTDQMIWPQTIAAGIATIQQASFLSAAQKRDILYNNAARFLRLSEQDQQEHYR